MSMTETESMGKGAISSGEELTVLVVDADVTVRESIGSYARHNYDGLRVLEAATLEEAADRLEREAVDCLVVAPDASTGDGVDSVAELGELTPACPVVWLTDRDPAALDDALLEVGTTIVEQGDDVTEWSFLFEKVQGAIQHDTIGDPDHELFRTLVESASDGLYTLDATGRVVYLNEAFAEMLQYDQEELFGVHASTVMADGELERGQERIQELLGDPGRETDIMDLQMVRKDGTQMTAAIHFRVLTTSDGTYDGLLGVVRDITERKRRERELQRQRDRLEEFASIVSHDLQTPLTVAKGRLELAQEAHENEDLDEAARALDRMEGLISDLLELAQQGKMVEDLESVELEPVVADAWHDVASGVDAAILLDLDGYTVRADADRLRQLFENLFHNALEHAGRDVTVSVGTLDDREGFYVEDDGPGLPAGVEDRIFDRAYTTSEDGTGFGLAIVEEIVEAHDWSISPGHSEAGGARFEITVSPGGVPQDRSGVPL